MIININDRNDNDKNDSNKNSDFRRSGTMYSMVQEFPPRGIPICKDPTQGFPKKRRPIAKILKFDISHYFTFLIITK